MRPAPIGITDVATLAGACLIPMAPMLLTAMPMHEIVKTALKILG